MAQLNQERLVPRVGEGGIRDALSEIFNSQPARRCPDCPLPGSKVKDAVDSAEAARG